MLYILCNHTKGAAAELCLYILVFCYIENIQCSICGPLKCYIAVHSKLRRVLQDRDKKRRFLSSLLMCRSLTDTRNSGWNNMKNNTSRKMGARLFERWESELNVYLMFYLLKKIFIQHWRISVRKVTFPKLCMGTKLLFNVLFTKENFHSALEDFNA